jgi:hypothetical protein
LAVLLGQYWALGNASVRSATRGGGRVLWCSVRRACVGSTGRVVVLPVHSRCEIGCVARVRWWCLSLLLVLFVIPLRTFPAGNGARAHGARAKAGAQSFFLSFFHWQWSSQLGPAPPATSGPSPLQASPAGPTRSSSSSSKSSSSSNSSWCRRWHAAAKQPKVRAPAAHHIKVGRQPGLRQHAGCVATHQHGPPCLQHVVVVQVVGVAVCAQGWCPCRWPPARSPRTGSPGGQAA